VASDESHYPEFDRWAEAVTYDRYHGYIKLDHDGNKAAFPFGFGMSYTLHFYWIVHPFSYNDDALVIFCQVLPIQVSVAGDQVVQLYIGFDNSSGGTRAQIIERIPACFFTIHKTDQTVSEISLARLEKIKWYNPETRFVGIREDEIPGIYWFK
jgi:hypothetical protein